MIKTFIYKGLSELWATNSTKKIDALLHGRIKIRLDALHVAARPGDMNVPGLDFHPLKGRRPVRCTVHVNGPWCITFEFDKGDAYRVNLEQYH